MGSHRASSDPMQVLELGTVEYTQAWEQQRAHAAARVAGTGPDVLMLLEHPSVYTAGRRTQPEDRPVDGTPVVDVDRGGRITWHGPGQLVGYPILRLAEPFDVVAHVRRLEEALIHVVRRLRADHRPRRRALRGVARRRAPAGPSARSPRSGCGWPAG